MIARVVALLTFHLAAGSLLVTALLVLRNALPPSFVRFCTGSVAGLALFSALMSDRSTADSARWAIVAVAGAWYLWLRLRPDIKALALLGLLTAAIGLVAEGVTAGDPTPSHPVIDVLGSTSSGVLLGAVTVTMVLGHWYLVAPGLSIAPLQQGALYLWIGVAARWLAVVASITQGAWELLNVTRLADVFFSTLALFFFIRVLTGLASPLLLAGLIWQTVKMRSTQSATGLLYVAVFLLLFGELIAQFLTVATGFPL